MWNIDLTPKIPLKQHLHGNIIVKAFWATSAFIPKETMTKDLNKLGLKTTPVKVTKCTISILGHYWRLLIKTSELQLSGDRFLKKKNNTQVRKTLFLREFDENFLSKEEGETYAKSSISSLSYGIKISSRSY